MGLLHGGRGGLLPMFGASVVAYLLRDEFTTDRAAGAVNGTATEPGPGTRTVADTDGDAVSISSGLLRFANINSSWTSHGIWYGAITRAAGRMLVVMGNHGSADNYYQIGWDNNQSGAGEITGPRFYPDATTLQISTGGSNTIVAAQLNNTNYKYIIALRTAGAVFFRKTESGPVLFLGVLSAGTTATQYPAIINYNRVGITFDCVRVPDVFWLPTPLASDGFGSAFGTTDGAGHAEITGIGSGGESVTWTTHGGTIGVTSGKAQAGALTSGLANATLPTSTKNIYMKANLTRAAGAVGLEARRTDDDNKLFAEHDGTNCYLKQRIGGVETTLITAVAAYSANAEIVLDLDSNAGRLYYNNTLVGTTGSINAGLTATAHGIRTTNTGNTVDDFVCYAKGSEGQYAVLDNY
jgi:hypothetical protein